MLVTGGTRGIGRAVVEACAAAGASVAVLARKQEELDETAAAVRALDAPVTTITGSVGDAELPERAIAHVIDTFGSCDVVVNNAAINPVFGTLMEADPARSRRSSTRTSVARSGSTRAAWEQWMREHGGTVCNVVSVGGLRPGPGIGAYNVSKAALIHLTRQLAQELAPGVRVNSIAPGLVKTDFARALWEPNEAGMARAHALGRLGVPDDIAAAVLFLISDASSWMTGELVVVDGGAGVSLR